MDDLNKLRWRCRRGTLELDLIFARYLDCRWSQADSAEKQGFLRLLALEDADLLRYLLGERIPSDPQLAQAVALLRVLPPSPQ